MITYVASSTSANPADAVLDVAVRLRAQGLVAARAPVAFALCFASHELVGPGAHHGPLHSALRDTLADIPFVGFVGRSAFHGQRIPERQAGLAVLVVVDDRPGAQAAELRHALLGDFGMLTASGLLVDAPFARTRFVALHGPAASGAGNILGEVTEVGGDIVGAVAARPMRHLLPGATMLSTTSVEVVAMSADLARRIGPRRKVTAASDEAILKLNGVPALATLVEDLPEKLRRRVGSLAHALFVAVDDANDDDADDLEAFFAANAAVGDEDGALLAVTGLDAESGAISVADRPRIGATIRFALRDAATARGVLDRGLATLETTLRGRPPLALIVFSSSSRDEEFLGAPLWDVTRVLSRFGPDVPVVGCTTHGELVARGGVATALSESVVVAALLPAGR